MRAGRRIEATIGPALLLVAGMAGLCLAVAALSPLYTDELAWKMLQGRLHADGGQVLRLNPTCGPLGLGVPAPLLPFRLLDSAIFEGISGPLTLRIAGVAQALAWLALTCWLLWARPAGAAAPAMDRRLGPLLALSAATLGVMPLLLVLNRPEQIMLVGLTVLVLPVLLGLRLPPGGAARDVAAGLCVLAGGGILITCHALSTLFWPLIVLFLPCVVGRRVVAWPVAAMLGGLAIVTIRDFGVRGACADPALELIFLQDSVMSAVALGKLGYFLLIQLAFLLNDTLTTLLVGLSQFRDRFTSDIFPPVQPAAIWLLGRAMAWGLLGAAIGGAAVFGSHLRALRQREGARLPDRATLAVGVLWGLWGFSIVARVHKNEYQAALLTPLLCMAIAGSLWVARARIAASLGAARWRATCQSAILGLAALSVVSQAAFLAAFASAAASRWQAAGYTPGQRFSVNLGGYAALRPKIVAAGALCGIDAGAPPAHLVVDELTYYVFQRGRQPILATYIDEKGWGRGIQDIRATLAAIGAGGMVVGCQWVPGPLAGMARRSGELCCVPPITPAR